MCGEQGFKTVYDTVQQVKCKGKGFSLIFSRVLMLRYLVLQDIQNTVFVPHSYGIRPGGTITEQSYKFPVCANAGVLFSLDIQSLVCDKHIETRFPLQQFRFWSITQPCHVSVHGAIRTKTQPGIRFSSLFILIKSRYFLILTIYLSYLDHVLLPIAVVPFIYWN